MMSLFCRSFSFGHIGGRSLVRQSCSATAPTVSFLLQRHLSPVQIASNHKFSTSSNQTESTSSGSLKYYYAPLDRSVIRVSGPETTDFLQGLISNDVRHLLENGSTSVSFRCIYSFILNTSGRIVLDLFVYSSPDRADQLLLEVDTRIAAQAVSLLKRYKVRRKVTVEPLKGQVFALYPDSPESVTHNLRIQSVSTDERLYVVQDPRNYRFGFRVLNLGTPIEANNLNGVLNQTSESFFGSVSIEPRRQEHYRAFRYEHGIGEGAIDFEPESVFPFEANAEILNGVSFQKGCYIGQELTARTYHTGVIRKRLVPIQLVSSSGAADLANLPVQNVIHTETGRLMGKFRAANGHNHGLAVLKFGEIFDSTKPVATKYTNLKLSQTEGVTLTTWRPFWWPDSLLSAAK